jgi:hypothetical protein
VSILTDVEKAQFSDGTESLQASSKY